MRVFDRHRALCSSAWELKEAPLAVGNLDKSSFWPISYIRFLYTLLGVPSTHGGIKQIKAYV